MKAFAGGYHARTIWLPKWGFKAYTWYHVVGTFDGKEVRIYVNGKLEGKNSVDKKDPVMVWNDNNIEIGGRPDTNDGANLYQGKLDELAVYNRALPPTEVVTVMEAKDILSVDASSKLAVKWSYLKTN